jgi:hypothetical protein
MVLLGSALTTSVQGQVATRDSAGKAIDPLDVLAGPPSTQFT